MGRRRYGGADCARALGQRWHHRGGSSPVLRCGNGAEDLVRRRHCSASRRWSVESGSPLRGAVEEQIACLGCRRWRFQLAVAGPTPARRNVSALTSASSAPGGPPAERPGSRRSRRRSPWRQFLVLRRDLAGGDAITDDREDDVGRVRAVGFDGAVHRLRGGACASRHPFSARRERVSATGPPLRRTRERRRLGASISCWAAYRNT